MGCSHSTMNCIQIQPSLTSQDILYLNESWTILKTYDIIKFADEVLRKSINRDASLRKFWTSKIVIDNNNYDYSQGDSCLRTDLSWHIGLREQSIHFISTFDKLLSSIKDENLLLTQIRSVNFLQNVSTLEYDSLKILKECITETIQERFEIFKYSFTSDHEQAWNKFLTFIVKSLAEKDNKIQQPKIMIIAPSTFIDPSSNNKFNQ